MSKITSTKAKEAQKNGRKMFISSIEYKDGITALFALSSLRRRLKIKPMPKRLHAFYLSILFGLIFYFVFFAYLSAKFEDYPNTIWVFATIIPIILQKLYMKLTSDNDDSSK